MADKQNIKSFRTLWIQFDAENADRHQLFLKEHSVRKQEPEYPKGRTLFLLNVPPYATTNALKRSFAALCGNVQLVAFTNAVGFRKAYVVFQKESGLEKSLGLPQSTVITLNAPTENDVTGFAKWCREYNESLGNENELKADIENYMNAYDRQVEGRIAREKARKESEEAAEGWVTVSSQKKRGQFAPSRKESTIDKLQQREKERNQKKQLVNFYTFQIRETKKQNLAELRKKFELDKKKLQELKVRRTFKPF